MDFPNNSDNDSSYKNLYKSSAPTDSRPTNQFAVASLAMGILTIVTTVLCTVFLPFLFSGLSIIFAVLSKGRNKNMEINARTGIITSLIGFFLNIIIVAGSFNLVFTVPEYKEQLNQVYEQVYGESFDEVWKDTIESVQ